MTQLSYKTYRLCRLANAEYWDAVRQGDDARVGVLRERLVEIENRAAVEMFGADLPDNKTVEDALFDEVFSDLKKKDTPTS